MATGQLLLSQGFLPRPSAYADTFQQFLQHYKKSELYLGQHVAGFQDFIRIGVALHLRNVAENSSLQKMDQSRMIFPSIPVINRMIQVAKIVTKENTWASVTSCPGFNRTIQPYHCFPKPRSTYQGHLSVGRRYSSIFPPSYQQRTRISTYY